MKEHNTVAIIPHYNHSSTVLKVITPLQQAGIPVIIVDDGSNKQERNNLQPIAKLQNINIFYLPTNKGKGGAVKFGLKKAIELGFSHAIQVDADAQHNLNDLPLFLTAAKKHPSAIICGNPQYGAEAPKARLYGRKITNFWNIINSLSFDIKDGMCGFRLYPLQAINTIIQQHAIGDRMDFDNEILIKAHWHNIPLHWINTAVIYNENGISHFRGFIDNWQISKMHARLFLAMLLRKLTGKKV